MKPLHAPHSLRARLLWFLLAAISLTALAQASVAYRTARSEADEIFDYHMQQMAMSLRAGIPVGETPPGVGRPFDEDNFEFVVQVWTADGLQVFQSSARAQLPQRAVLGFSNVQARNTTYRVFSMQSRSQVIQVAQDMAVRREMATALALRTVAPIGVLAPVLMLLVWWVVGASLAPVSRVRRQVAARQADDLDEVSEAGVPDEIRPLVRELNLLFARVRQAFDAQKNFVADAAHELRSPLTALKLQARSLERATDEASRKLAIERLNAGIDRATRLVEQLMVLARQQANAASCASPQAVALAAVARLAVEDTLGAAQARGIDLGIAVDDEGMIDGHPDALRIMLRNLLENAVKYTPSGGTVDVDLRRTADSIVLSVDDSGPGIPAPERERVFDRFYRVAGTEGSGSGLGLGIVKAIADTHSAKVSLDRSTRLGGLRVVVSFPARDLSVA